MIARGKREATARQWRGWVKRFVACCGEKGEYDRADVIKFLLLLRGEGYCESSLAVILRPIKLLATVQGWLFPQMSLKKVRDTDISRPLFSFEEVSWMIRRGKQILNARELALLALATTYGLRRQELSNLGLADGTVTVDTVKGGVVTTHLVPLEIKPYLAGYRGFDIRYLTLLFHRIVEKLGMELNGQAYGWHSIRRALVTELVSRDVPLLSILRFMRWSDASLRGQFGMVVIYAVRAQEQIDRSIFLVHPFLPLWGKEKR